MEEETFKVSLAAVVDGEYTKDDVSTVKKWLESLNKKEAAIKKKMDKNKRDFLKNRERLAVELNEVKSGIKDIKNILKGKRD